MKLVAVQYNVLKMAVLYISLIYFNIVSSEMWIVLVRNSTRVILSTGQIPVTRHLVINIEFILNIFVRSSAHVQVNERNNGRINTFRSYMSFIQTFVSKPTIYTTHCT
jgi:hypothetical protein